MKETYLPSGNPLNIEIRKWIHNHINQDEYLIDGGIAGPGWSFTWDVESDLYCISFDDPDLATEFRLNFL